MAKQEHDREDLLREATALVERVEFFLPDWEEPIVAGFRLNGSASLFFGGDPVYQFNSLGQLRRAFVAGRLYRAEHGRLVSLDRRRTDGQVHLVRHDLDANESTQFLANLHNALHALHMGLRAGDYRIHGQVPASAHVIGRLSGWLEQFHSGIAIARSAHAR